MSDRFIVVNGEALDASEAGYVHFCETFARRTGGDVSLKIFSHEDPQREPETVDGRTSIAPTNLPSVMCNGRDFFIRERGRWSSTKISRRVVESRFGKAFLEAVLSMPFAWIDFDNDPRACQ